MKKSLLTLTAFCLATCLSGAAFAACETDNVWKVSLAQLPTLAEKDGTGVLVDYVKTIAKQAGVTAEIKVAPFARSVKNVETGSADIHIPMLQAEQAHNYSDTLIYSDADVFKVPFMLYTKKGSSVQVSDLGQADLKVETDTAHKQFFSFNIGTTPCQECSLKKVAAGRLDGYIFAKAESDALVAEHDLTGKLDSNLYKEFPAKALVRSDACGEALNTALSSAMTQTPLKMK